MSETNKQHDTESRDEARLPNREDFERLVHLANKGDERSVERLRQTLDECPEIWQQVGDLGRHAEIEIINLAAGNDRLLRESVTRQLEELKRDLAGPEPSALEKLAVDRVVACWLHVQHVDIRVAQVGDNKTEAKYWAKRQDQTHRRYEAAMKMLVTLQQLLPATGRAADKEDDTDKEQPHLRVAAS